MATAITKHSFDSPEQFILVNNEPTRIRKTGEPFEGNPTINRGRMAGQTIRMIMREPKSRPAVGMAPHPRAEGLPASSTRESRDSIHGICR